MRQLVYIKPGVAEWQDAADPRLASPDDAIVRPIAVAACDLDTALMRGLAPFPGPFPLGHEFVAEIVAVGEAVRGFAPGQRVIVPFQIACGQCDRCRRGLTGSCSAVPVGSMYGLRPRRAAPLGGDFGGALADLVRVPFAPHMLAPMPAGAEPAALASVSDNVSDAWRTVAPPLRESPGAAVLIVGSATSIPLYAILVARACGAGRVDFVANDPKGMRAGRDTRRERPRRQDPEARRELSDHGGREP